MKSIIITLIIFCGVVVSTFAGGPWPMKKGKGYIKLSEYWIVFSSHYTDAGKTDPNVTTGIFNTNLYTEYGFTDRLTGIYNGTLFSRNYMNNLVSQTTEEILIKGEALNSVGDMDLGLKYGITRSGSKVPVSITVILGLPTGKTDQGSQKNLQTGDGEFNQLLQADIGTSIQFFQKINGYTNGYIGFNNRTNGFSDEFRWGLEAGLGFFKQRLWVTARINSISSLNNGDTVDNLSNTSIFANNTEFVSPGIEFSAYITRQLGVSVSYAGAISGQIIAAAPSYSVGVFYDLSR